MAARVERANMAGNFDERGVELDEYGNLINEEDDDELSTPPTMKELLTRWGAGITFVLHICSIAIRSVNATWSSLSNAGKIGRSMLFISGIITFLLCPAAVIQERKLTMGDTLRELHNKLREEANRLSQENEKLAEEIDDLEVEVHRLQEIENALKVHAAAQGESVQHLRNLVKENKEINKEMRKVLRARALERVVTLVVSCDSDGDFILRGREIDELIIGMRVIEELDFDEERFRSAVSQRVGSVHAVLEIVKELVQEDEPGGGDEDGSLVHLADSEKFMESMRSAMFGHHSEE